MGALKRRTLQANSAFHARLGEWAGKSGQDAASLKRRVKTHLGEYTDLPLPNDPLTDQLLGAFAKILVALGRPDLMWVLPDTRCVRFFHTSSKFSPERMREAIDTVDLLAAEEGYTLGPTDHWTDNDGGYVE